MEKISVSGRAENLVTDEKIEAQKAEAARQEESGSKKLHELPFLLRNYLEKIRYFN